MSIKQAVQKESQILTQVMQIKQHLFGLEESANRNRSDISKLFNDIRNKVVDRESTLKKQISETLEKEQ